MSRSIATRTGDDGTTGLLYGQRVPKDHPQIEAVGTLDELNASLGAAKASLPAAGARAQETRVLLERIQRLLVALMGEVACAESDIARFAASTFPRLGPDDVRLLDDEIARLEGRGLRFDGWATPGANPPAAALELARTAARRAERRLTALTARGRVLRPELRQWINRLSDCLWLLAREQEQ
jgi:cob(I)alamin adenosyltransferase